MNQLKTNKERNQLDHENLLNNVHVWREKFEEEQKLRQFHEKELLELRNDVDSATLLRTDLERQLETSMEEMELLKSCHESEAKELHIQRGSSFFLFIDVA